LPKSELAYTNVKGKFTSHLDKETEALLMGANGLRAYKKMAESDAICSSFVLAITKIFQSLEWKAVNDPKGALKRSLKNVNWPERLEEIVTFLIYGFADFEVTIKQEEDGVYTWSGFYFRPQSTIADYIQDSKGNIKQVEQWGEVGENVKINANRILHFASRKNISNPWGKSIFRGAFRDWYYRTNIEKVEAIGVERDLTGLPVLTPSDDVSMHDADGNFTKEALWAWEVVRQVKRNEQEGLVLPPGWSFELQGSPGERQFDLNAVINRYDAKIAMSVLAQFLILGVVNSSGSFALAKEQSDLFHKAVEGFAKSIANVVNTQWIGSPALGLLNDTEAPRLEPVGAQKLNLSDLASFLGRLLKFNIITPDDELEAYLRKIASLPDKDESTSRPIPGVTSKLGESDKEEESNTEEDAQNTKNSNKESEGRE